MRTLVYKRTHSGDPDSLGRFGIYDCMGRVRSLDFEAVIGVGGQGVEAERNDIAYKLTWIGIGAHKTYVRGMVDPIVTFDHFLYFGTEGELLELHAPQLTKRMYVKKARIVLDDSKAQERSEVQRLLAIAEEAPPSQAVVRKAPNRKRKVSRPARC
jgi:hypothetical protein